LGRPGLSPLKIEDHQVDFINPSTLFFFFLLRNLASRPCGGYEKLSSAFLNIKSTKKAMTTYSPAAAV
jgi:hypothetical protein